MASSDAPSTSTFTSRDGLEIVTYRWTPKRAPRGLVQLTHGMGEHVLRYHELALALNDMGYLVAGQDHRGHGTTAGSEVSFGNIGAAGWTELVNDIHILNGVLRKEHPDLPLALIAHSMGSFAAQQCLLEHSDEVDAVVLTGTALADLIEPTLDLDKPFDLAAFNAPFAPARTDCDWLSRDESQVDAYLADPRCGFGLDIAAMKALFAASRAVADPQRMAAVRTDLPIYVAVGDQDPVNGQLASVHPLIDRYRAAGLTELTLMTYPGARHELFNETNRGEVIADMLSWLDRIGFHPQT
ncbi:alpha/beta fold hydrolase [Nocardia sp. NPDC052278]|uniref:alpha/beta fold hydrolase n=1 Tax=unclassified Nocardia TaxID=2637762 RepID=UPI0036AEDFA3